MAGPEGDDQVFCCGGCAEQYGADPDESNEEHDCCSTTDSDGTARDSAPPPPDEARGNVDLRLDALGDKHVDRLEDGTVAANLHLEGIHCSSCVRTVERMPSELEGVVDARLSLARERLRVRWRPNRTDLSAIAGWLEPYGYRPRPLDQEEASRAAERERELLRRVGICWALAANVMMLTVPLYAGLVPESNALLFHGARWVCLVLATIAVGVGGRSFFARAWHSFAALDAGPLQLSMDVPISLGIAAGWSYSVWSTIAGSGEVWFDSISVLIAALLTARWLKARGRRRAVDASSRLAKLVPSTARPAGRSDERVPVDRFEPGDDVLVSPGERVPVDGDVVDGTSSVSRAILTGESRPEAVAPGDEIFAGVENLTDEIVVRATELGDETRVGRMMDWLEEEDESTDATAFADRFGGAFVLATLAAATATAIYWWSTAGPTAAIEPVVALLVIACPCALGLAVPLASTVASGRAAKLGIFVERKGVFDALRQAGAVVFDKTGTLTAGRTRLVDRHGDPDALSLAAEVEAHSSHPLAAAFDEIDRHGDVSVDDVEESSGAGIGGRVDGHDVVVGRPDWVESRVDGSREELEVDRNTTSMTRRGLTPVGIGVDGEFSALVGIGDPIRSGAGDLLEQLDGDRRVELLSGDHPATVDAVARDLGLPTDAARGGMEPEEKVERLGQIRAETDGPVVMVGDGVNDTVALDEADVGVAVGRSADAALSAADVVCRRPGVEPVGELFEGAESLGGTVRGLLTASVAYNLVAVAAAAAGWIDPLAAAVLMPTSSTAVVLAALWQPAFREAEASDPSAEAEAELDRDVPPGRLAPTGARR
ncbi:MAG: heavy metal translocating P-type ATPase [Bradymonadaceae bacterium]